MLKNAKVIDEADINLSVVSVGTKLTLHDIEYDEKLEYTIVGSTEANPAEGKISDESPVGKALLGRKKGETVDIETPGGTIQFKILKIGK